MQPDVSARPFGDAADACAEAFVASRHLRQSVQQRAEIEEGPAGEDGTFDGFHRRAREACVIGGVELLIGLDDIKQMMRNAPPRLVRRFRAADIEPAVNLDRIVVDALPADRLGNSKGQLGLAGASRTGDYDWEHWGSVSGAT